jgi:hypothetical protein
VPQCDVRQMTEDDGRDKVHHHDQQLVVIVMRIIIARAGLTVLSAVPGICLSSQP